MNVASKVLELQAVARERAVRVLNASLLREANLGGRALPLLSDRFLVLV